MVTIHRDEWGVPHIFGPTDECVVFGMGYAQAEDYFWQLEDTTIRSLGRYAEVYGPDGIEGDLLNRAFEVVPRSQADYVKLPDEQRLLLASSNMYAGKALRAGFSSNVVLKGLVLQFCT